MKTIKDWDDSERLEVEILNEDTDLSIALGLQRGIGEDIKTRIEDALVEEVCITKMLVRLSESVDNQNEFAYAMLALGRIMGLWSMAKSSVFEAYNKRHGEGEVEKWEEKQKPEVEKLRAAEKASQVQDVNSFGTTDDSDDLVFEEEKKDEEEDLVFDD